MMSTEAIKMGHVTFDTLKFVERLETAGIPARQAKAILEAQRQVIEESLDNTLATKLDILELKTEMKLQRWILGVIVAGVISLILKAFF